MCNCERTFDFLLEMGLHEEGGRVLRSGPCTSQSKRSTEATQEMGDPGCSDVQQTLNIVLSKKYETQKDSTRFEVQMSLLWNIASTMSISPSLAMLIFLTISDVTMNSISRSPALQ